MYSVIGWYDCARANQSGACWQTAAKTMCRWLNRSTVFTACNKTQMIQRYSDATKAAVCVLLAAQMTLTPHSSVRSVCSVLSAESLRVLTCASHSVCCFLYDCMITRKAWMCLCVFSAPLLHKIVSPRKWHLMDFFNRKYFKRLSSISYWSINSISQDPTFRAYSNEKQIK